MGTYNRNHKGQATNVLKLGKYGRRGFTRILNETLCNRRLGIEARAILAYLLSKPRDWKPRVWALAKEFRCGKHVIRKGLKNLAVEGYARMVKSGGGYGKAFGYQWQVRESPELSWLDGSKNSSFEISTTKNFDIEKVARIQTNELHKQKSSTNKRDKGASARRASFDFVPKYPYPESEEECYATLEAHGVEIERSYDGNFFEDMVAHNWTINGEPVKDWIKLYEARVDYIMRPRR
jgi:hypothetical protein